MSRRLYLQFTDKKFLFKSVQIYRKDADPSENDFLIHEFFCATFSFSDMVDFVFNSG